MGQKSETRDSGDPEALLTLSADRKVVLLHLPPVRSADMAEPLRLHIQFNAKAIDSLIDHLVHLRARMLPRPKL